ncbi:MAG: hypothetical protein AAGC71_13780 [Pseudomonadota bacterium]
MNVQRSATALLVSIVVVALLVIGLAEVQRLFTPKNPEVSLQRIDMAAALPPPPPPPRQRQRSAAQEAFNLELGQSTTSALKLPPARIQQTLSVDDLQAPIPDVPAPEFDMDLSASIQEFGLAQLDGRPRLLTSLSIQFPDSLRRQGIDSVSIQAQVVIDQNGGVTLRRLIDNPHAELEPQIRSLIRRARFTPPEKDGRRVRAAFIWPLTLKSN